MVCVSLLKTQCPPCQKSSLYNSWFIFIYIYIAFEQHAFLAACCHQIFLIFFKWDWLFLFLPEFLCSSAWALGYLHSRPVRDVSCWHLRHQIRHWIWTAAQCVLSGVCLQEMVSVVSYSRIDTHSRNTLTVFLQSLMAYVLTLARPTNACEWFIITLKLSENTNSFLQKKGG